MDYDSMIDEVNEAIDDAIVVMKWAAENSYGWSAAVLKVESLLTTRRVLEEERTYREVR